MTTAFRGQDLAFELLDPKAESLVRLYKHPGGDWDAPPEQYRNLRVDPPLGHKGDFAVLYTANTLPTVACECRVLRADERDRFTWDTAAASQYHIVRYAFHKPAMFVPIDGPNRARLELAGPQRSFTGYEPYQAAALALFQRFGHLVHGLSWESFHRNQPGRIYAVWHHHKATIGLEPSTSPHPLLRDDPEWIAFLDSNKHIEAISP